MPANEIRAKLDQIKGHLVWMPLDFLKDAPIAEASGFPLEPFIAGSANKFNRSSSKLMDGEYLHLILKRKGKERKGGSSYVLGPCEACTQA